MVAKLVKPNLYDLQGDDVEISFSASSFGGDPLFQYRRAGRLSSFQGDQIRMVATEIGSLVTVTIEADPDLHSITLTLLLPDINLREGHASAMMTEAILTAHRASIGGPQRLEGQLQSYTSIRLKGVARAVDF